MSIPIKPIHFYQRRFWPLGIYATVFACVNVALALASESTIPSPAAEDHSACHHTPTVQTALPVPEIHAPAPAAAAPKYHCPMHPEVVSEKPGNCPKCGMFLEPVNSAANMETAPLPAVENTHVEPAHAHATADNAHAAPTGATPPVSATPIVSEAAVEKTKADGGPTLYTCGMHPQIIRDKPGKCPICGMNLEPVRKNAATGAQANQGHLYVSPQTVQRMNLKTVTVAAQPLQRTVRAPAMVAFDESKRYDVALKYDGFLEKVFVNTTWEPVRKGDALFEVYSPALYNAALNYQAALRAEPNGGKLTAVALAKLALLDVSSEFLREITREKPVSRTYVFPSPVDGVVLSKNAVQGRMLNAGESAYEIADLSAVWVNADLYGEDADLAKIGQTVDLFADGSPTPIQAKVLRVIDEVNAQTRTVRVRLSAPNTDGRLRPGAFLTAKFAYRSPEDAIVLNDTAILRSGEKNTVFIAHEDGTFAPRQVTLGARGDDGDYVVVSGLSAGERVVTSGQFLLDSESRLREAIDKMQGSNAAVSDSANAHQGHAH